VGDFQLSRSPTRPSLQGRPWWRGLGLTTKVSMPYYIYELYELFTNPLPCSPCDARPSSQVQGLIGLHHTHAGLSPIRTSAASQAEVGGPHEQGVMYV
jgi:hypothetical protein